MQYIPIPLLSLKFFTCSRPAIPFTDRIYLGGGHILEAANRPCP